MRPAFSLRTGVYKPKNDQIVRVVHKLGKLNKLLWHKEYFGM